MGDVFPHITHSNQVQSGRTAMATQDSTIPYDEIDAPVRKLVRVLNDKYPCIRTGASCGGHENPQKGQWEAGTFYVTFHIEQTKRGWRVLEFLAWAINHDYARAEHHVQLIPLSRPPYLNTPGECLHFSIEGFGGESPDELAGFLKMVRQYFA
jgi:hypothetical protein